MLRRGDLLFWGIPRQDCPVVEQPDAAVDFTSAVLASAGNNLKVFHVSMLLNSNFLIHATCMYGVIQESVEHYCKRLLDECDAECYDVIAVKVLADDRTKDAAADFCVQQIGCGYNDLFSDDCINSNGQKAYYCCQLVRKAYQAATASAFFPVQIMKFDDENGVILPYWLEYFRRRAKPVPLNDYGSHPARLLQSDRLRLVFVSRVCRQRPNLLPETLGLNFANE
ncbi:unnamed protein product [Soboliphyme baturini]|uniref:Nucleotid_trans domain-containing protein n=1 Tax=Soboliphyme baturini TaxID=241478 RepID=A0A183J265_9BILA|nr:unnamed protein product [Soboliphyme baturini]